MLYICIYMYICQVELNHTNYLMNLGYQFKFNIDFFVFITQFSPSTRECIYVAHYRLVVLIVTQFWHRSTPLGPIQA
jgi:hypothetical protein